MLPAAGWCAEIKVVPAHTGYVADILSCPRPLLQALPAFIFLTIWANLYFMLTKGVRAVATIDYATGAWITTVTAVGCAVLSVVIGFPLINKKLKAMEEEKT